MSRIRSTDTKPEVAVRSVLHGLGYRFRKNVAGLVGKPDIVLKKYNVVIFVHGCFWHRHPGCNRATTPKSNMGYWIPKLKKNVTRDRQHKNDLEQQGWRVLTIWECEVGNSRNLKSSLEDFLD